MEKRMHHLHIATQLRCRGKSLHPKKFGGELVEPPNQNFVVLCHQKIGLAMMIPSTVGVPASTSSITSLRRSPPADCQESAGVLSSEGVTPAVPPPCTGVRSRIVSLPL